jgi:hypothetical protein
MIYRLILCVINGMLAVGTSALELYGVRLVSWDLARCRPQTIFSNADRRSTDLP